MAPSPKMHFGAEFNRHMLHLLPTVFLMQGEYEQSGEPAGLMLGFSWFGLTLSVVWC